jgi:hypothetical protein
LLNILLVAFWWEKITFCAEFMTNIKLRQIDELEKFKILFELAIFSQISATANVIP